MKKVIHLSIAKPCTEKFSNFTPTPKGGFCGNCEKEVIDFTTMNERELMSILSNKQSKTCGRFTPSQLKNYSLPNSTDAFINPLVGRLGIMSFSLLALCTIPVQGQETTIPEITISTTAVNSPTTVPQSNSEQLLTGVVLDETNQPLPGVNVVLKGTTIGVQTDFDGKFTFSKKLELNDVLVFSYLGFHHIEYKITQKNVMEDNIKIIFEFADMEMMGELIIEEIQEPKQPLGKKIKNLFK